MGNDLIRLDPIPWKILFFSKILENFRVFLLRASKNFHKIFFWKMVFKSGVQSIGNDLICLDPIPWKILFFQKFEICIGGKFSERMEKNTVGFSFFSSYIKTAVISKILMRLPWNFEYKLTSCFSTFEPEIMIVNCRVVACTSLPSGAHNLIYNTLRWLIFCWCNI